MTRLTVHVTPKSIRDDVCGWRGEQLCVRVTAAPENGKANAAVERVIAEALGLPKSRVRVVRGHAARVKRVEVDSADADAVAAVFGRPQEGLFEGEGDTDG